MAEIAGATKGLATRQQLLGAGITDREIGWRLRTGSLIEEFPGVYR